MQRRDPGNLAGHPRADSLADVLERVLDKGIVIAGDIQINLLDIELLTIKLRLVVASVDKAKEIGIDWWERDPALSRNAEGEATLSRTAGGGDDVGARLERIEEQLARLARGNEDRTDG